MEKQSSLHDFPFQQTLSLEPVVELWRRLATESADADYRHLAERVVERFDASDELHGALDDTAVIDAHRELVDVLFTVVFPVGSTSMYRGAASVPYALTPVYQTPAFQALDVLRPDRFYADDRTPVRLRRVMHAYHHILRSCYNVSAPFNYHRTVPSVDRETGLATYWRIEFDMRFCRAKCDGSLQKLDEKTVHKLLDEPENLELWRQTLPPEHYRLEGLVLVTAHDITDEEVISQLKHELLGSEAFTDPERIDQLERYLQTMLRRPHLKAGLIALDDTGTDDITRARAIGRSLLLSQGSAPPRENISESHYTSLFHQEGPLIVRDLKSGPVRSSFESHLVEQGFRALMLVPLRQNDRMVGILELAAPKPESKSAETTIKLERVAVLFASAISRAMEERETTLQALIKKHYTAVHPAVEWRFREAALQLLETSQADEDAIDHPEPIVFDNVYGLYGLSDVRGSSTLRLNAISQDLGRQLVLARTVLEKAEDAANLSALSELRFRLNRFLDGNTLAPHVQDEGVVLMFLGSDVEPLFEQLAAYGGEVSEAIDAYHAAVDVSVGMLYAERKKLDAAVTQVSDIIARYLDYQQEQAQAIVPHYYQRYRTDGVDHTMYAGASMQRHGTFTDLHLRSLRLWQLESTCGVIRALERKRSMLEMPLEVAHLILVQSSPLAIRFRQDEKQFDVDGAYNVRYEIVKKRIDKAHVQTSEGIGERLTQPGKIAIVYTRDEERLEYLHYLEYLIAEGYLEDMIEEVDVEDLPGVTSLKALRVTGVLTPTAGDRPETSANGAARRRRAIEGKEAARKKSQE